jgi:hypothetical protein
VDRPTSTKVWPSRVGVVPAADNPTTLKYIAMIFNKQQPDLLTEDGEAKDQTTLKLEIYSLCINQERSNYCLTK